MANSLNQVNAIYTTGESTRESLKVMSEDLNAWTDTGKVGAILGFGVFLLTFLIVIVLIFLDISKNGETYEELIKDDLNQLN
eukprot:CAMPEP_0168615008 /NCGR_PEP_ID=MMETSP0449_2-20121227/4278_1 /TAXON_ID=1082188 /ORGANISM="Strombidium rassoulzadegani, Strain ras09" /LENGTH=81 /DNA_ID=CAMNT_0008655725 /DNA_START=77 /DNA_END=322 /DNA_ORIENTATION=-